MRRVDQRLKVVNLSATAASRKAGLSDDAIRNLRRAAKDHPADRHGVSTRTILSLAPVLGTTAGWLLEGIGPEERSSTIALAGYAGAGEQVFDFNGEDPYLGDIEAPPGCAGGAAVVVRGESMRPRFVPGDVVVCEPRDHDPRDLVGRTCYVRLADGRRYIKKLTRGSQPDLFTLRSVNPDEPDIEDQSVDRAFPVAWVKLRN